MAEQINKSIKCRVSTCKYHDSAEYCKLPDIVIGAEKCDCKDSCQTECMSFQCGV